jgi:very-short-patch-repair endonuclease
VGLLASRQHGRVARRQLALVDVYDELTRRWVASGYLIRRLPGVYAVGHVAPSVEAVLTEALLYAGPDAALTGAVGAWWLGLRDHEPATIEVATPRRCIPRERIEVHGRRIFTRVWHRDLPTAPVADVLLDYATTASDNELRRALANAEYRGLLDVASLESVLARGRAGSAALRAALQRHQPELARTQSAFERLLLGLCERERLPIPQFNRHVAGYRVDALWPDERVIVEVDGRDGHSSWARIRSDRARDLALRRAGYTVLRYVWEQLADHGGEVAQDIENALSWAEPSAAPRSR